MQIRFTNHAQIGMSERGISESRVINAVRTPDSCRMVRDSAIACIKTFGAKQLEVIYRERRKSEYVIITAYYL